MLKHVSGGCCTPPFPKIYRGHFIPRWNEDTGPFVAGEMQGLHRIMCGEVFPFHSTIAVNNACHDIQAALDVSLWNDFAQCAIAHLPCNPWACRPMESRVHNEQLKNGQGNGVVMRESAQVQQSVAGCT